MHSRRFYEVALRQFHAFCGEKSVERVDSENVYESAQLVRGMERRQRDPAQDHGRLPERDQEIPPVPRRRDRREEVREQGEHPSGHQGVDERPLTLNTLMRCLSLGTPNKKMMAKH